MREVELLALVRKQIEEIFQGWKLDWQDQPHKDDSRPDCIFQLRSGREKVGIAIEAKASPAAPELDALERSFKLYRKLLGVDIAVLAMPQLSDESRRRLKERGIGYIDASGNAWIQHQGILVDRAVPKSLYPHESKNRSIFADKASLILRYLLDASEFSGRVREISAKCGLDAGYVSKMLKALVGAGYAVRKPDDRFELVEREALVSDWVHAYHWSKNQVVGFFYSPDELNRLKLQLLRKNLFHGDAPWALTMHAGANLLSEDVRYEGLHIYSAGPEMEDFLKRMGGMPAEKGGNVFVLKPYYRNSALYGVRDVRRYPVVSDLQLYLDLYHFPIRGREAADGIWRQRLAEKIEAVHG